MLFVPGGSPGLLARWRRCGRGLPRLGLGRSAKVTSPALPSPALPQGLPSPQASDSARPFPKDQNVASCTALNHVDDPRRSCTAAGEFSNISH